MNSEQIEKILQNPPMIKTPDGLLERLTDEIRLPRVESNRMEWTAPTPWFKRWLPALSFITIFLVCLVAIAVQTNMLAELRRANEKLRSEQGNLETLRTENAEVQRLRNENQELERLRKDNLELKRLRDEVAQLQKQTQGLTGLRALNAQLHAAMAANPHTSGANEDGDLLGEAQAKAERIKCVNNLKQIGLAARVWSGDNKDVYPTNFISMTNELTTWVILQCPSDKSRNVSSWADVEAGSVSYQMDAPGISDEYPNVIYAECPIHHNVLMVDGSVQQLSEKAYQERVKVVNGLKTLQWQQP